MNSKPHVFVSYFRENEPHIRRILSALDDVEVAYWIDREGMEVGEQWKRKITSKIDEASLFLFCLSSSYSDRPDSFVHEELRIAAKKAATLNESLTWIVPFSLDGTTPPQLQISDSRTLADLHCAEFSEESVQSLAARLAAILHDPSMSSARLRLINSSDACVGFSVVVDQNILKKDGTWTSLEKFKDEWSSWGYGKYEKADQFPGRHEIATVAAEGVTEIAVAPGARKLYLIRTFFWWYRSLFRESYYTWSTDVSNEMTVDLDARQAVAILVKSEGSKVQLARVSD